MSKYKPTGRTLGRPRNPRPENPHCAVVWDDPRSAAKLGERLGVNAKTIHRWRNGRVPPRTAVEVLLSNGGYILTPQDVKEAREEEKRKRIAELQKAAEPGAGALVAWLRAVDRDGDANTVLRMLPWDHQR